jgi:TRAP-type mannitol/chloroaromatic compound transport system permease small subunit|tara:strand:+ start:3522 stop:4571 length:1050 start_codon:yes stop_codon:yes gene_type:complete
MDSESKITARYLRILSYSVLAFTLAFLINNILTVWVDWPGVKKIFSHYELFGFKQKALQGSELNYGYLQIGIYLICIAGVILYVFKTYSQTLEHDSEILSKFSAYLVRSSFWAVFLVGVADFIISFMVVERLWEAIFSPEVKAFMVKAPERITFIHFPIILGSFIIGYFTKSVGFIWLAVLVVLSEFVIVLSRFIFSYEQAFQGDLVRFWYAALYLFASAYALIHEGHVRVDVLYSSFSERKKAWTNSIGSALLGVPLCLIVIFYGLNGKASIINGPVVAFEVTQQGSNGLYLLYLMAVYLGVFAVTMLLQFTSYFMSSSHKLLQNDEEVNISKVDKTNKVSIENMESQ